MDPEISWYDIHATSKVVLSYEVNPLQPSDVLIEHAQEEFLLNVGLSSTIEGPVPLHEITCIHTDRITFFEIELGVMTETPIMRFINFRGLFVFGQSISCHIILQPIRRQCDANGIKSDKRWAIMTVRSASSVGNSRLLGLGVTNLSKIPQKDINAIFAASATLKASDNDGNSSENSMTSSN